MKNARVEIRYLKLVAFSFIAFVEISFAAIIATPVSVVSTTPDSFSVDAANLLVTPNNTPVQYSSSTQATYGGFHATAAYDSTALSSLMGVSAETLSRANFVAFDANNGGGGFEDSIWSFSDGVNSINHVHDYADGPNGPVIANSSRFDVGAEYNDIFGTTYANSMDFGVILFDLAASGVDVNSPDFRVSLQGGGLTCGYECPDVTFMGSVVPIPAAFWLFASAIGGFGFLTHRKRVQG
jgi:hypothetical protein